MSPSARALPVALGLTALAAIGCSAPVVDDVADAAASTQALVIVERTTNGDGTQANVSAKFMRLSQVAPESAERVLGTWIDAPARGTCARLARTASDAIPARSATGHAGSIELLDAGDVTLRSKNGPLVTLAARAFPDVGELVSGVLYTSRPTDLPSGARLTIEGTGSALIDRFTVDAEAPPSLEDLRVGDSAFPASDLALDEGAPIELKWQAARASADRVMIDATTATSTVRCMFDDTGEATLPGEITRSADALSISVHRLRTHRFTAPGLEVGEVRFDVAVAGRAAVLSRR
jgi:hypothetical protein